MKIKNNLKSLSLLLFGIYLIILTFIDFNNSKTDYIFALTGFFLIILNIIIKEKKRFYLFIISFSVYLLIFTLGFFNNENNNYKSYKHMHIVDENLGYRLNPGWTNKVNNNFIKINSHGFRDDEFKQENNLTVLLGDSFTFGNKSDQTKTIDKMVEKSCNIMQVHNLGVGGGYFSGYGIDSIIKNYKNYEFKTDNVIYLFFNNDLSSDSISLTNTYYEKDGFLINKKSINGLKNHKKLLKEKNTFINLLKVRYFFSWSQNIIFYKFGINIYKYLDKENYLLSGSKEKFSDEYTKKAFLLSMKLKKIVEANNSNFLIFIIPSKRENKVKKYSKFTENYINLLKSHNIKTIELIDKLNVNSFLKNSYFLSTSGNKIIGEEICKKIKN